MKTNAAKVLAVMLMFGLLLGVSGCQKKEIASDAAYGAGGAGGGAAGRKGIGEQDLGGGGSRPGMGGTGGSAVGSTERSAFENEDVPFAYDSSALSPQAQDILRKKAAFLKAYPNVKVTIEGHTDERGTNEYNLALGEARAKSAKAFLVDLGIPAARMATISYGEERPLAKGRTEADFAQNRRAHFVIEQ
jgi:peptidoglycan-associated lipoprotein